MDTPPTDDELVERHPALRRLSDAFRRPRIPVVQQLTPTECGAACLAMVLRYHGRRVRLDELRDRLGIGRDGTSARKILEGAQRLGLTGRGVKLELDDLDCLEPGAILHWDFNPFVVFERLLKDGIEIVDPASGRRR